MLTGTWTAVTQAPAAISTMILLSDGTVMASASTWGTSSQHDASKSWYKLTPDAAGNYANGTWSQLPDMNVERLYFPANVLPDGRVFVAGGKYDGPNGVIGAPLNNTGEIYNPVTNSWSRTKDFPEPTLNSAPTMLLANGTILAETGTDPDTYIYDPATNTWAAAPSKLDNDNGERESLTKLPDGSGISVNAHSNLGHAQRYDQATNSWIDSGMAPANPINPTEHGLGPATLLPDGRVFQIGRGDNTAMYTPATTPGGTGTWAAGPVIPGGSGLGAAAVLPNGHVLYAGGELINNPVVHVVEFDPIANSITNVASPATLSSINTFVQQMLMLPSGQVLFSSEHSQLYVYTPDGAPQAAWKPTITSVAANGDHYTLTGTQLNGLDAGASYQGDGTSEMDSNYPIIELKDGSGKVYFARTSNWSSTGVQTGSTPVSTDFSHPRLFALRQLLVDGDRQWHCVRSRAVHGRVCRHQRRPGSYLYHAQQSR